MTTEDLLNELKTRDHILPKDVLKDTSLENLADDLKLIFDENSEELRSNIKFRENYIDLISYVYVLMLQKKPEKRNKEIFNKKIITSLINTTTPHAAI